MPGRKETRPHRILLIRADTPKPDKGDATLAEGLLTTRDIHTEYARRRDQHRAENARCARQDGKIADWRLYTVIIAVVMAWMAFGQALFFPGWLVLPALAFLALVVWHERVVKRLERSGRSAAFYEGGLRRLEDRWAGTGTSGDRFSDPAHPYSADLDLFGRGSLFDLLCTARTRAGEDCLAAWLRAPADLETIRARQRAIAELRPRLDLREQLALLGEDIKSGIDPEALVAWGSQPALLTSPRLRLAAALLAAGTLLTLAGWALGLGVFPFLAILVLGRLFEWRLGARVKRAVSIVERPARDLRLLSAVLARLESERFQDPLLQKLRGVLAGEGISPSSRIERLQTLLGYLAARNNPLIAAVLALLLWVTQCAFAIEGWRVKNGPHLSRWLEVVGEFEALCALSGYASEHPDDPFPELVEAGAIFHAEGLRHPLLPLAQAVPNDVCLDGGTRLLIVSGSNMSGKSTLLRTIGTNGVLALAGAPVRARHLRLTPVSLGASIRTLDSLQGGTSRFYAEITRLRQIVDIAREKPPLLFLLDEILHGTNSHDRRVGAEAVVRALIRRGAIGLVTTHDLALARLVEERALAAANVHFEDQLEDGQMTFDYCLRPGVVEKSNALALMRAVGLEV